MASLQIRKLPTPLHQKLVDAARREHRSVPQQAIALLAEGLNASLSAKENRRQVLAAIGQDAARLKKYDVSDPVDLIRQDRL
jgi:plasmid stability protein